MTFPVSIFKLQFYYIILRKNTKANKKKLICNRNGFKQNTILKFITSFI